MKYHRLYVPSAMWQLIKDDCGVLKPSQYALLLLQQGLEHPKPVASPTRSKSKPKTSASGESKRINNAIYDIQMKIYSVMLGRFIYKESEKELYEDTENFYSNFISANAQAFSNGSQAAAVKALTIPANKPEQTDEIEGNIEFLKRVLESYKGVTYPEPILEGG